MSGKEAIAFFRHILVLTNTNHKILRRHSSHNILVLIVWINICRRKEKKRKEEEKKERIEEKEKEGWPIPDVTPKDQAPKLVFIRLVSVLLLT